MGMCIIELHILLSQTYTCTYRRRAYVLCFIVGTSCYNGSLVASNDAVCDGNATSTGGGGGGSGGGGGGGSGGGGGQCGCAGFVTIIVEVSGICDGDVTDLVTAGLIRTAIASALTGDSTNVTVTPDDVSVGVAIVVDGSAGGPTTGSRRRALRAMLTQAVHAVARSLQSLVSPSSTQSLIAYTVSVCCCACVRLRAYCMQIYMRVVCACL